MKFIYFLLMILVSINPLISLAYSTPKNSAEFLGQIVERAWEEIEASSQIYPHFFVYGLEVEASAGLSDVADFGTSLGIELHFERITK